MEQVSLPPLPCGLDFVKELIAVQEDKITQQGGRNAMNYYLKGRTLSCSIVVDMIVSDFMSEKPILYDGMIRVTGFIYDKGEILEQQVELLMPVAEAPNIKREIFYSDVKKGSEYPFQSTYRQIIKFTGNFYESPETAIGGIVFMFKPDKFEYIKPNPKTEIASYKGQPKFAFDENNSSASNEHETKAETKNTTEETPKAKSTEVENTTKTDNAIGLWTGDFGKDKLQIIIESIDANGVVKGYDEVKGNKRTLTGSRNENTFTLNEPGDDKWDGIFTFKYDPNAKTIAGEWKANNGKASKNFTLTK